MFLAGVPAVGAAIVICAKVIVAWAEVPGRVDKIEKYIDSLQRQTEVQSEANRLMQEQLKQQQTPQPYCELYQGSTWCFDERSQQWYQQGGQ